MKKSPTFGAITLLLLAVCGFTDAGAQSLGEIARKVRAEKRAAPKATRVFTNENIPREGGLSTTTSPAAATSTTAKEKEAAGKETKGSKDKKSLADEEKEWRGKFAKLREQLNYEERKLDVQQRELNLAQIQNYSDPNVALREQNQRTEINKRTQEMEKQRQAVDQLKKAIADLEEELHRKNLPAGWAQ